ncbi:putative mitochondrial carrier [Smittium culicis]|uniref:Putative mitochondrial carrier n=1 Tax=Smittium culicis TaxID=133412 RepID=A0A1R1YGD5_9FUNG|nr:putative mitochondrial carrier [Smittium culicis]
MAQDHDYEELPETTSIYLHMAAGAAAGIMEHAVMYPFDISTTEGIRALWRGIGSMVAGAGPSHALYFAAYEEVKYILSGGNDNNIDFVSAGIAGGAGTIMSDMLMNPFDDGIQLRASNPEERGFVCLLRVVSSHPSNEPSAANHPVRSLRRIQENAEPEPRLQPSHAHGQWRALGRHRCCRHNTHRLRENAHSDARHIGRFAAQDRYWHHPAVQHYHEYVWV